MKLWEIAALALATAVIFLLCMLSPQVCTSTVYAVKNAKLGCH